MRSSSADPSPERDSVTRFRAAIEQGEAHTAEQLLPLVYDELRRLARARLASESSGQTLEATALVHEAYLRLVGRDPGVAWDGRGHFFAAAAESMRRILVDAARRKRRLRHGGGLDRIDLDQAASVGDDASGDVLALHEVLDQLSAEEPIAAEVVKLRYFAGLTTEQAALALGISLRTANRHWAFARAWLYEQLRQSPQD
jgi:RNA polymerase sigma factor (TIGR02999 family)